MLSSFLKAKIHQATVTDANLEYRGSISISPALLEASGMRLNERVEIYNITNGERFATYIILGKDGEICINGAAAWKARKNDRVIICTYALLNDNEIDSFRPKVVLADAKNGVAEVYHY